MDATYNQFIGMYTNVFPEGWCENITKWFEINRQNSCGGVKSRQFDEGSLKVEKDDEYLFFNLRNHDFGYFGENRSINIFWNCLQNCFDDYVNEYDVLKSIDIRCTNVKIQKTNPGSGYHVWHHEQGNRESSNRSLAYMIYLNDIDEAGETEFLYQRLRIPPKENCCLIWPAGHTHAHRGNVVHGNQAKYVITGWFHNE
tara:strand:+ start:585 stop:1181 length:597 start_codon:yes stop_codon:yes gene_type:complete